jgi:subtilisin-like proprotein convertase family protein
VSERAPGRATVAAVAVAAAAVLAAGPAEATTKTRTYSSGPVNAVIPDARFPAAGAGGVGTLTDAIAVRRKGKVKDVDVSVRITHAYDRDLELWLLSPTRTIVKLVLRRGGNGDDFGSGPADCTGTPTVLDDQAPTPVAAGSAPFAGSFAPEQPLSALNGSQARGAWTLFAVDTGPADAGTLHCWGLKIAAKAKRR